MGQKEIYEFLKRHPYEWFDAKQISQGINIRLSATNRALMNMRGTFIFFNVFNRNGHSVMVYKHDSTKHLYSSE